MSHRSHSSLVGESIPAAVTTYISNSKSETIRSIFNVQRSASLLSSPSLLRVRIENFLTHRDKTVDFVRPITLIHGQNGSGKSSVLQAIHYLINGNYRKIRDNLKTINDLKTQISASDDSISAQTAPFMRVTGWFWNGSSIVAV